MPFKQSSDASFKKALKNCDTSVAKSSDEVLMQSGTNQAKLSDQESMQADVASQSQNLNKHKENRPPIAKVTPVTRSSDPAGHSLRNSSLAWNSLLNSTNMFPRADFLLPSNISMRHGLFENPSPLEINYFASLCKSGLPYQSARYWDQQHCSHETFLQRCSRWFALNANTLPLKQSDLDLSSSKNESLFSLPTNRAYIFKAGNEKATTSTATSHWNPQKIADEPLKKHVSGDDSNVKKRRSRTIFSRKQIDCLEEFFEDNHYPNMEQRHALAISCQMDEERIQVWFQNRRAKWRKIEETWGHSTVMAEYGLYGAMIRHRSPFPKTITNSKCKESFKNTPFVPWLIDMHHKGLKMREQSRSVASYSSLA